MSRSLSKSVRQKNHRRGRVAEWMALVLLTLKGYRLLALRYKTPVGEIDLVVRRGRTLAFVEVKARATHTDAATAIHATNQSRVLRASQMFLMRHPEYANFQVRFDAVLVPWYSVPKHLTHAFSQP